MGELLKRFREPSTWAGLSALSAVLAVFGINIPAVVFHLGPQLIDVLYQLLGAFGVGAGALAVTLREKPAEPPNL